MQLKCPAEVVPTVSALLIYFALVTEFAGAFLLQEQDSIPIPAQEVR